MRFQEYLLKFKEYNTVSHYDIEKVFGTVDFSQLSKWKDEKKLVSPRRGHYVIAENETDNLLLANELNYSYISLEFALSYHQIIPDIAQVITSVSKERSEKFSNEFGAYWYRKINGQLFTGFNLIPSLVKKERFVRFAEPEKALFDLIYFRSDLKDKNDFDSLRLNLEKIKIRKIEKYLTLVSAPQIKNRISKFIDYLYDSV